MKITKKVQMIALVAATTLGLAGASVTPSYAINVWSGCSAGDTSSVCSASKTDNVTPIFQSILSLLMYAIGIVSVLMIVIGGFKYVTANGDASSIQSAKNTILYSVIGLIVAILGQAIILFVVNWLK